MEPTAKEILLGAKAFIEKNGWNGKGGWQGVDGSHCVVHALRMASNGDYFSVGYLQAYAVLGAVTGGGGSLVAWNDTLAKSKEAVLSFLDKAVEALPHGY